MTQDTVKSLVPSFLKSLEDKGRSPATVLAYRSDLDQLVEFLTKKQIATAKQIKTDDLNVFRDTLLAQKYTPKSVSRKLNAIKSFFRFMVSEGKITADISKIVAHPKIEVTLPKFLTPLEYRALRDAVRSDARISAIIELILQTGLRISEVANLKLKDAEGEKMTVEAHATQPQRTIPMNSLAQTALKDYIPTRPKIESEYVFISKTGKPLAVRNIRAAVDRYIQRAELPKYSVNDIRTTFMVENIKAGVDLVLLSQVSGHKRLSTTERYLELAQTKESGKKQTLTEL